MSEHLSRRWYIIAYKRERRKKKSKTLFHSSTEASSNPEGSRKYNSEGIEGQISIEVSRKLLSHSKIFRVESRISTSQGTEKTGCYDLGAILGHLGEILEKQWRKLEDRVLIF